ncbi:MAG: carboxypeptidase-like regulatory domain-containing protein, partial [Bacteroidota bacterium]
MCLLLLTTWSVSAEEEEPQRKLASMVCNDLGQVALDQNCSATVMPDDVLEGTYPDLGIFTVEITDANGNSYGNMLSAANIGQTLTATVTDTVNGNTCDGLLSVVDNLIPTLTGSAMPVTIPCSQSAQPVFGGTPGFPFDPMNFPTLSPDPSASNYDPSFSGPWTVSGFDPCGDAVLTLRDSESNDPCGTFNRVITRTWTITDASGNSNTISETIQLERPSVMSIDCPPNWTGIGQDSSALSCTQRKDPNDNTPCSSTPLGWNVLPDDHPYAGHPSPFDELFPGCSEVKWFGTGVPGANICSGVQSSFEDTRINICTTGSSDGCYKILREWVILDWCSGEVFECTQVIKVEDNEAPIIEGIEDSETSVGIWNCEATWIAPAPSLSDECSSENLTYTVGANAGTVTNTNGVWRVAGLAPGTYDITYSAFDCCGNQRDSVIQLTVVDNVAPVAICDQNTVVSLTTSSNPDDDGLGLTKAFASTFDDGSFDNCSDQVWFKVLRMDQFDSNGNGINNESVILGDYQAIDCDGADGDDDLRRSPPFHPNYNLSQAYFDDFAQFCCNDLSVDSVVVVFRVFDIDPEPFTFGKQFPFLVPAGENPDDYNGVLPEAMQPGGPLYGHYSDCMVNVEVQDKLPPFVVAPPNITVSCDYWFAFDPDNPNANTDELDANFGKVVIGSTSDLDSIIIRDRVCPAHPRFGEFAPASIFDDPCYDDQYDIYWGQDGYALDNCGLSLQQTVIPNLNCGRGTILRRWQGIDDGGNAGNIATQTITIIDCKEFYVPDVCWRFTAGDVGSCDLVNLGQGLEFRSKLIEWPCDVELTTCQQNAVGDIFAPANLDIFFDQDRMPRLDDDNCSLLAATFDDTRYTFVDNACVKVFREWTVIDWCLYEDGVTPFQWSFTQVIKLLNSESPTFATCADITVNGFGNSANLNEPQCVGEVSLDPGISDDCTPTEDLRIDYKIDENNDGDYDFLGYSNNYGSIYPFPNPNNLPVTSFDATAASVNGFFPVGTHRILWNAEDGCGNVNSCSYLFTIED